MGLMDCWANVHVLIGYVIISTVNLYLHYKYEWLIHMFVYLSFIRCTRLPMGCVWRRVVCMIGIINVPKLLTL